MIRAAAWFCAEHHGIFRPAGKSWQLASPDFSTAAEIPAIVGRPVKYYSRMTAETRCCLFAASLALKVSPFDPAVQEVGLLCTGSDGVLRANTEYFRDYVANGRTLGRGNLFIYTLPTSAVGEVAIALNLSGPSMFIQSDGDPIRSLGNIGTDMISFGEAAGMLGIWSSADAAVCISIDLEPAESDAAFATDAKSPLEYCMNLRDRVRRP